MTQVTSIATRKPYTIAQVCRVWKVSRCAVYRLRAAQEADRPAARRRGPTGPCSDEDLLRRIRVVIDSSPFHGEGHRKVWARLRFSGTRTSKSRVLRIMRSNDLLAPHFPVRVHGSKAHDGTITTSRPDEMWGTDATAVMTRNEGSAFVFLAVDHCTGEVMGLHASASGSRQEALEPLRQGVRRVFGTYDSQVASGLTLRHDHGSQYTSHDFQQELRFLGIRSSPSYVAEPECNGVAERFVRTLKEQLLWIRVFDTVEELRQALIEFMHDYNHGWLVQKHKHLTPAQARAALSQPAACAA
jgi:transposase InsO family protein